jgi:UDP:flavonoid glycosyltransferase YjiC (YdhE family)
LAIRFLLGGFGTRGDVQPMFALGLALRERGHQVRFVGPPDFSSWASALGVEWVSVGESMEKLLARIQDKNGNMSLRAGFQAVAELVGNHYRWMEPLVQDCDVIAAASLTAAGASFAEKHGKRYHYVAFCPQIIPSAHHPISFVTSQKLPRWLNRLSWSVGLLANNAVLRKTINGERARLGLPAIADPYSHVLYQRLLVASEPSLAPLPADLPPNMATQTGAWFMPEPEELPADVEAFLAAGPPPVYVGFGSMQDPAPAETSRRVLDAVRRAGTRVLLSRGWAGLGDVELPPTALLLGSVPHGKLFPRCAAVVHHGGAGTTANATRAGVPQVVVPHAVDQFYWGHRVWKLGLSPPPIPKTRLRAEALAAAIRTCIEDTGMRQRAASFANGIRTDGLARAVTILEGDEKPVFAS